MRIKASLSLVVLAALSILAAPSVAYAFTVDELLDMMVQKQSSYKDWQADIKVQSTGLVATDDGTREIHYESTGKVLGKGALLRSETEIVSQSAAGNAQYSSRSRVLKVYDGKTMWFMQTFDSPPRTLATKADVSRVKRKLGDDVESVLSAQFEIRTAAHLEFMKNFWKMELAGTQPVDARNVYVLKLTLRPEIREQLIGAAPEEGTEQTERPERPLIILLVDSAHLVVVKEVMTDVQGSVTSTELTNFAANVGIPASAFAYEPEAEVDFEDTTDEMLSEMSAMLKDVNE